jgi:acyl-CoA hydrolase
VSQSKRPLPVKFLDAHLERVLLEQRRYQKRTVFGAPMLRGLFTPAGSSAALPAYLPESVADKLPLVVQMKVRLIAEAAASQDQYESHPQALRVVALGRAMAVDGWRR